MVTVKRQPVPIAFFILIYNVRLAGKVKPGNVTMTEGIEYLREFIQGYGQ